MLEGMLTAQKATQDKIDKMLEKHVKFANTIDSYLVKKCV